MRLPWLNLANLSCSSNRLRARLGLCFITNFLTKLRCRNKCFSFIKYFFQHFSKIICSYPFFFTFAEFLEMPIISFVALSHPSEYSAFAPKFFSHRKAKQIVSFIPKFPCNAPTSGWLIFGKVRFLFLLFLTLIEKIIQQKQKLYYLILVRYIGIIRLKNNPFCFLHKAV